MFAMFVPTIRNGLSEDEAIQIYTGFSKRPMDEVKERILINIDTWIDIG